MGLCGAKVDSTGGSLGEIREIYTRHAARKVSLLAALVLFLAAMALLAAVVGAAAVSAGDVFRVIAASVVPAYQGGVFR